MSSDEIVAELVRERQKARRAEVTIAARYPEHKPAPVSGVNTQEIYTLYGMAVASQRGTRRRPAPCRCRPRYPRGACLLFVVEHPGVERRIKIDQPDPDDAIDRSFDQLRHAQSAG